jgi:hypothetical protein
MSNYISPDNKFAWSYETQIKSTLPDGRELWNVTDYSRTTSGLQSSLFAYTFHPPASAAKSRRTWSHFMRILRGQVKDIDGSVMLPENVTLLNFVPQGTTDLAAYEAKLNKSKSA